MRESRAFSHAREPRGLSGVREQEYVVRQGLRRSMADDLEYTTDRLDSPNSGRGRVAFAARAFRRHIGKRAAC
jgi:hypothetical protein